MSPQAFMFMGRYGSGKGTQAKLLIQALNRSHPEHKVIYLETGAEFRKFQKGSEYTAKLSKQTVEQGHLMPEFMCVFVWGRLLVEEYQGNEFLVFDGTPRKLLEAKIVDSIFPFYSMPKPTVIYLDVEHAESHKRLKLRALSSGRADDGEKEMENRKRAYESDVIPTIEHYRTNPNVTFLDIDGERSIEEIHADIVKRIGLA